MKANEQKTIETTGTLATLLAIAVSASGCSGQAPSEGGDQRSAEAADSEPPRVVASADPERIAEELAREGFDPLGSAVVGDQVVVEGDMVIGVERLMADSLLPGTALPSDRVANGATVLKGYYHPMDTLPNFDDVCVQLVPGAFSGGPNMPSAWADAFEWAVNRYDDETFVHMRWAEFWDLSCGAIIWLVFGDMFDKNGNLTEQGVARGELPAGYGLPGNMVTLNRNFNHATCPNGDWGDINDFPRAEKRRVALHELGHTLGLRHGEANFVAGTGEDPPAIHIPTTAENSASNQASYPSVMYAYQGCLGGNNVGDLSADDIRSMNVIVYFSRLLAAQ